MLQTCEQKEIFSFFLSVILCCCFLQPIELIKVHFFPKGNAAFLGTGDDTYVLKKIVYIVLNEDYN